MSMLPHVPGEDNQVPRPLPPLQPLGYEAPRDQISRAPGPSGCAVAVVVTFGALVSMGLGGVATAYLIMSATYGGSGRAANWLTFAWLAYGVIFLLSVVVAGVLIRRLERRTLRRWWLIGMLLGVGVGSLIGGVCFVASVR